MGNPESYLGYHLSISQYWILSIIIWISQFIADFWIEESGTIIRLKNLECNFKLINLDWIVYYPLLVTFVDYYD